MMNVKKVVLGAFTVLLLTSSSFTPVLADSTKHAAQTQKQTIDMQTTKTIQNIMQLAKQGKLPNVPFQIGTPKSTIVIDTPKRPKVDGIACPETDEYNVLVTTLEKEERHLPLCVAAPTVTREMSHKKTLWLLYQIIN